MITIYKLALGLWMLHITISEFIDHLLWGFLYHFNATMFTVPQKKIVSSSYGQVCEEIIDKFHVEQQL